MDLRGLETETQSTKESLEQLIAKHKNSSVEDLVHKIGLVFIPVFFVYTGMQINFGSLLQPRLYVTAGVIALVGIAGKVVAGFAAKGKLRERLLVGSAMVPRGEVGLIFAATGRSLGVLDDELFSVIVLVVVITTFVAPPLIKRMALATHPDKVSN